MKRPERFLSIHLTDRCNNRCVFCVVGIPERRGESIDVKEVRRVLGENAGKGYQAVNLHGGEPTLHPNLIEILELIRSLGYPEVHIQTNGRRMADRRFVERLLALNVNLFIVSMHGLRGATHGVLTRSASGFGAALCGIRNVKMLGGRVRTNTVVSRPNLRELADLVSMLADEAVDHINISNLHPVETAYQHFDYVTPTLAEIRRWVPTAVERALQHGVTVTLEGFPHCAVPALEPYLLGPREIAMQIRGLWIPDYDRFMEQGCRVKGEPCEQCIAASRCGGVYREYVEKRGWSEFSPVTSAASHTETLAPNMERWT